MKSDRKLTILFFLICSAVAGTLASINYFSVVGGIIVKGVNVPVSKQNIVKEWHPLESSKINVENLSLAQIIDSKETNSGGLLFIKFNATKNLSVAILGIKINGSIRQTNWNITVRSRDKDLGTNLLIILATTNSSLTSYLTTVSNYINWVYNKNVTLKLYGKDVKIPYSNMTMLCTADEKKCSLEINNVRTTLGYKPDDKTDYWFDLILVTDGPGDNKEVTWDVFIKVWS